MVTDVVNKRADVVAHIKATTPRLSEARITGIAAVSAATRNQLFEMWSSIPAHCKTHNSNLGCA